MRCRLLLVVLALAAGCGDDDDEPAVLATTSSTRPVPTACPVADDAVSFAVAAEATSTFVVAEGSATCTWTFEGGSITLNLERGAGNAAHERYAQIDVTEPVAGLGDDALWVPDQRVLSVLDDGDVYMVLVSGVDDPLRVARDVAGLALAGS